ncbi:MAG: hypothetical protein V4722_25880 [Bacteroidota bacterium]
MGNPKSLEGGNGRQNEETNEQETIFEGEEFSQEAYEKSIRFSRIQLFVVGGIQLVFGITAAVLFKSKALMETILISIVIAAIFIGLGIWTKSKPFTAIVVGILLYASLATVDFVFKIESIRLGDGLIFQVFVVVFMIGTLKDAGKAQDMGKHFNNKK